MSIKINTDYLSSNNNSGTGNVCKYIVIHETDNYNVGANAKCHAKAQHDGNFSDMSVHFYAGSDGVYQAADYTYKLWHIGRMYGSSTPNVPDASNANSIGIEICVNSDGNYTIARQNAIELTKYIMKLKGIPSDRVVRHYDCKNKYCPRKMMDTPSLWTDFKNQISSTVNTSTNGLKATALKNMSETEVINKVGKLFTADQKKNGILASVSLAQFILESGYGKTELAQKANNCFGMKTILSGNTWNNSTWDGTSVYTKVTNEEYTTGIITQVTASFRKYTCIEDSISDHSAYLLGAKNGSALRYKGLKGEVSYKKAITIIKNGGYATDSNYINKICNIIEKWDLTKFDTTTTVSSSSTASSNFYSKGSTGEGVKALQKDLIKLGYSCGTAGADGDFGTATENAVKEFQKKNGLTVDGIAGINTLNKIQELINASSSFKVKVTSSVLRIRESYSTQAKVKGYTGIGTFTIVSTKKDSDGNTWGLLKSYKSKKDGWICISLDCVKRV